MRSVPLSAESNHLKVTSTPEPLSLTISIFIYRLPFHAPKLGSRSLGRSIEESRHLIVPRMDPPRSRCFIFARANPLISIPPPPSLRPLAQPGGGWSCEIHSNWQEFRSRSRRVSSSRDIPTMCRYLKVLSNPSMYFSGLPRRSRVLRQRD